MIRVLEQPTGEPGGLPWRVAEALRFYVQYRFARAYTSLGSNGKSFSALVNPTTNNVERELLDQ